MKLALLTRYSRLGASTRLRTLQYLPALERAGMEIILAPFFDDDYLVDLYSSRRKPLRTPVYYAKRLGQCRAARHADVIWIEKEALPWVPWALERALLPRNVPYVVDYDDSVFHRYDLHSSRVIRDILGRKIDSVMAGAACVTVGNDYLGDRARSAGARRLEYLPTVVDMDRYSIAPRDPVVAPACIGWIGTPRTWKGSAEPVFDILKPVLQDKGARFRAIGAKLDPGELAELEVVPWDEQTEVAEIQRLDVGIMPLHDDPWTRGKCGYKLIQYMACGVPVVASPIGVNKTIVQHGVNGFLADSPSEWRDAIAILIEQPDLRRRMGAEGRKMVESEYCLASWSDRLVKILRGAAQVARATPIPTRQEQQDGQ